MKKIISLIFLLFISTTNSFAQNDIEFIDSLTNGQLKIIPVAGYNLSTLALEINENNTEVKPSHGFHIGIMFMRQLPRRMSIEAGFVISTSGSSYDYSNALNLYDSNNDPIDFEFDIHQDVYTYNFIFPLKMKHKMGYKRLHYYFEYGIYFGVAVETNLDTRFSYSATYITGETVSESLDERVNTTYESSNAFDFGVILGAGFEINTKWQFGASISYGFINQANNEINDINYYYYIDDTKFKNRNLMVTLGYIL